jgi:hypothetical protein
MAEDGLAGLPGDFEEVNEMTAEFGPDLVPAIYVPINIHNLTPEAASMASTLSGNSAISA